MSIEAYEEKLFDLNCDISDDEFVVSESRQSITYYEEPKPNKNQVNYFLTPSTMVSVSIRNSIDNKQWRKGMSHKN